MAPPISRATVWCSSQSRSIMIRFAIVRVVDVVFDVGYDNSSRVGWIG